MTMEPLRMTHLEYAKRRDVVFFFGAGASVADGIPLQACILPKALSQSRVRDSQVGREVVRFLERFFGLDSTPYDWSAKFINVFLKTTAYARLTGEAGPEAGPGGGHRGVARNDALWSWSSAR